MICPICDVEITKTDKRYLFGNDKPYLNVYVHKECFDKSKLNIVDYIPKMFEMYRKHPKKQSFYTFFVVIHYT